MSQRKLKRQQMTEKLREQRREADARYRNKKKSDGFKKVYVQKGETHFIDKKTAIEKANDLIFSR